MVNYTSPIYQGTIQRVDPQFYCRPLITQQQAQELETPELINKMYDGGADKLIVSILGHRNLSSEEIAKLKRLVEDLERGE
ncbi:MULTISPECIES: BlaI/MecI/CopY family transcriptional regulator [Paenibacillus]|uniref:BlaI/MecI/CopY family transcriptional regulator n=1 Tax=Paenibacillus TaxID=44249 RepID=UPI000693EFF5|nr:MULTISPECIES: BlaI/MecI/CopY family transcriptional regulator [Paenibacillus]AUO08781.1 hypothetical protein C0638_20630 [Paenibacillus sp. lzh-N1]QOH62095.1 hypothetical protein DI243_12080 [Paenibacillus polymyxa]